MTKLNRRDLLSVMTTGLMTSRLFTPGSAFAMTSPQDIDQRLAKAQQDGKVDGLHTLLVSQGGKLVFEHYQPGQDESWGYPLGTVAFAPDVLHDLRSVSKSVVALLYGIALADGKVPPPEAKLYDQFPEYADLAKQPGRDRLTMHHVLSMTLGLEWDELTIPYGDLRNSENAMEAAPDRFRFILERPDRRRTRREVDLLRRRHRAARPSDREGRRRAAVGLCPPRAVRSLGLRCRRMDQGR